MIKKNCLIGLFLVALTPSFSLASATLPWKVDDQTPEEQYFAGMQTAYEAGVAVGCGFREATWGAYAQDAATGMMDVLTMRQIQRLTTKQNFILETDRELEDEITAWQAGIDSHAKFCASMADSSQLTALDHAVELEKMLETKPSH